MYLGAEPSNIYSTCQFQKGQIFIGNALFISLFFFFSCVWTFWYEHSDSIPVTASQGQEMQFIEVSLQYGCSLLWRVCLLDLYVKYQHKGNTIVLTVMIFFILLNRVSGPSLLAAPSSCCSAFLSGCALGDLPSPGGRCEAAQGTLVLLLSLSPTQGPGCAPQSNSAPTHRVTLHWQFSGRDRSTADGKEKRGVCFSSPNCLNRKAVQRGPRSGEGNQGEPSDGVGRTQMVENRTWKWHSRKLF